MSLPRYPKYKDSGVEWLGEVPEHWEVKRLKHSVQLVTERTDRRVHPVALENIQGWTGRFLPTETEFQGEGVAFVAGDILFGKLRPYLAKAYLAACSGEAVGDFHVFRPSCCVDGRFTQYQILSREFIDIVDGSTFGSKMPRASWEFVGSMLTTMPPLPEQTSISAFLDSETAKIDALVAEQQRLIELLKEKRQAVISHAVTKGLNPDAPMKDSGIEWLGEVPAHWEVKPLKYSITKIEQGWSPPCENGPAEDGEWGVLKVGCGNGDKFDPTEQKALPPDVLPEEQYEIRAGDILMSRGNTGELVGAATLVEHVRARLLLCDLLYRFRAKAGRAVPSFLVFSLRSLHARFQIKRAATGTSASMKKIGQGVIRDLLVPLPAVSEQGAIVTFIAGEASKFDTLTAEAQRAIELLQERRTALISAAVTGQIDVRSSGASA